MSQIIHRCSDWVNRIFWAIACIFLALILGTMFYSVVMRYIFNATPAWGDELARYCYVWMQMLAAAVATKHCSHTKVSLISDKLKGKWKKRHTLLTHCIILVISIIIVAQSVKLLGVAGARIASALPISMFWVYISLPVGGAAMILHTISNMIKLLSDNAEKGVSAA